MRRSTGYSAFLSLLKSGSAGALALATILSCSDNLSPKEIERVQVESIDIFVPDSVKNGPAAEFPSALLNSPLGMSANAFASAAANLAGSSCGSGTAPVYALSKIAFSPEPIPNIAPYPIYDDGVLPDRPLGFSFNFYGKTYQTVNIFSNGFLTFGALPAPPIPGFPRAGFIPSVGSPNNLIAFAWTDWQPDMISDPIRYELRGDAPNRRFVIQFNNVPEFSSANRFNNISPTNGGLMTQIVLSEGSNNITIYTNKLKVVNTQHLVTQGIENEAGTVAVLDSIQNAVSGLWSLRRQRFFNLTDEAIRFSPPNVTDTEKPVITQPANIPDVPNDPGLGSAVVAVASPLASDNCALESVLPSRSDGKAMDAPYPVGLTTITWTAKDVSGNTSTATQSITVFDWEDPIITSLPASFTVNATSSIGTEVSYVFTAWDNVAVTSLTCDPVLGSRLPIGVNPVTCTASDAAGHQVSGSFEVNVIDAPTQMVNLIAYVKGLGLGEGTTNPLVNELEQAFSNPGDAISCKKMSDFTEMLIKKGVDDALAAYMTAEAQRIMTVMKCPTVSVKKPKPRLSGT